MKKAFLFVLGMMLMAIGFTGCKYFKPLDGPGMERDSADLSALGDSIAIGDILTYRIDVAPEKISISTTAMAMSMSHSGDLK